MGLNTAADNVAMVIYFSPAPATDPKVKRQE